MKNPDIVFALKKFHEGCVINTDQERQISKMTMRAMMDPFNGWIPFYKNKFDKKTRRITFRRRTRKEQKQFEKQFT